MSQENLEMVGAAMEAFNRRDGEAFGALLADDAEIVPVRAVLEGTVYRGPDAASQYCAAVNESWESLRWEVEEIRDGNEWGLAVGRIRRRGRSTGAVIDASAGWVARFRGGLVTSFHHRPAAPTPQDCSGRTQETPRPNRPQFHCLHPHRSLPAGGLPLACRGRPRRERRAGLGAEDGHGHTLAVWGPRAPDGLEVAVRHLLAMNPDGRLCLG